MRYVLALLIKFVMTTVVLWGVLGGIFGVSFANILLISVLLTGGSFLIGDLFFLPKSGNIMTSILDLGLVLGGIVLLGNILYIIPDALWNASFISALGITIGELFFHMYMTNQVLVEKETTSYRERN